MSNPYDLEVSGPTQRLCLQPDVAGAKNAAMPLLAAASLCEEAVRIKGVPKISDIENLLLLLNVVGSEQRWNGNDLVLSFSGNQCCDLPRNLSAKLRGSVYAAVIPAVKYGRVSFSTIGGDKIAGRSLEPHLRAFAGLGYTIQESAGALSIESENGVVASSFCLDDKPGGITASALALILAACTTGTSEITGISWEPEVHEVAQFLVSLGAKIERYNRSTGITGPSRLQPSQDWVVSLDRVVWGTYAIAALTTGGSVRLPVLPAEEMAPILDFFVQMGVEVTSEDDQVLISGRPRQPASIVCDSFPSFPPDLAPIASVLMSQAPGISTIEDRIYPSRYDHIDELKRMGLEASFDGGVLRVRGKSRLRGTNVSGSGIRETTALLLAGLVADGRTEIANAEAISRGYPHLVQDLSRDGVKMQITG